MNDFTIRDLENLSGIKAHTIRIWEQRYSFLKPKRTETNIRHYTSEELKAILNIALLNKYGYKISHIDKMGESEMRQKIISLTTAEAVQDRVIHELIQCMIDLDTEGLETAIDKFVFSKGIDKTITQIIFPFLERIGILWMTSHINPAQEHVVSNIVRQKMIAGIESTLLQHRVSKMVLLFLPEGEHHELGLLYMHYLLKARGIRTLYLGADLPFKDLEFVVRFKKPHYVYTHLTTRPRYFNVDKFLTRFATQMPGVPLVISGELARSHNGKEYPNVQFKNTLSGVMDFIGSL
jgi:MerR family transcriptional regulator, light-induced transcriptional regulator